MFLFYFTASKYNLQGDFLKYCQTKCKLSSINYLNKGNIVYKRFINPYNKAAIIIAKCRVHTHISGILVSYDCALQLHAALNQGNIVYKRFINVRQGHYNKDKIAKCRVHT